MGLSPNVVASLRALSTAADSDRDLARGLQQLLAHATQAVPSCLGVSLLVVREVMPVTLMALSPGAADQAVLSSLAVPLPTASSETGVRALTLYASVHGAFASMAPDLLALLDLDPRRLMIDGHLQLPQSDPTDSPLRGQLDELATVDRALGVLLDKGLPRAAGWLELERLAAGHDLDIPGAATLVLATVRTPSAGHPRVTGRAARPVTNKDEL